nr:MAG TPA: hypothetical protein [Caudoviricetes sp.]
MGAEEIKITKETHVIVIIMYIRSSLVTIHLTGLAEIIMGTVL